MSISEWLRVVSTISDESERLVKVDHFIHQLESELVKTRVFERELPLCMLLLNDAIKFVKEESKEFRKRNAEPVLKQFIPTMKESSEEPRNSANEDLRDKGNWLSSVQLWNIDGPSSHDHTQDGKQNEMPTQNYAPEIGKVENRMENFSSNHDLDQLHGNRPYILTPTGGCHTVSKVDFKAFSLLRPSTEYPKDEVVLNVSDLGLTKSGIASTLASTVQTNHSSVGHRVRTPNRKQRRCWSQELHRSFLNALQYLGGAHVATPKQIREIMQVDGLSNDEVKSHLQKYRLHRKKGASAISSRPVNEVGKTVGTHDQNIGNPSKPSSPRSGSPKSAFQFSLATGGTSTTAVESVEDEEISEGYSSKDHNNMLTQKGY